MKSPDFSKKTLRVAEELIGCYIVRNIGRTTKRYLITETEAYIGPHDLASHASKGQTKRTEVMFAEPGTLYVYLIYGMYYLLNVVTEKAEYPAAVLIRGVEGVKGPGRVGRALEIDMKFNGKKAGVETGLWFEPRDKGVKPKIRASKRIGVEYAGAKWSEKEFRFVMVNK